MAKSCGTKTSMVASDVISSNRTKTVGIYATESWGDERRFEPNWTVLESNQSGEKQIRFICQLMLAGHRSSLHAIVRAREGERERERGTRLLECYAAMDGLLHCHGWTRKQA